MTSPTHPIGQRLRQLSLLALVVLLILTSAPATRAAPVARRGVDAPALHALLAQAQANGAVRVIVRLNAPFSADNERGAPKAARSQGVIPQAARTQREGIQRAQDAVLHRLAGRTFDQAKRYQFIPYLTLAVDAPTLTALAADPDVADIQPDTLVAFAGGESMLKIGGNPQGTWGTSDLTGTGSTIAILDTGVMKTHQFLSGRVVAEACYSANDSTVHATSLCPDGSTASTAPGSGVNCPVTIAYCDHGTHVAGIAAGRSFFNQEHGPFNGVARDANLVAIQVASAINWPAKCQELLVTSPCAMTLRSNVLDGLEQVYWLATHTTNIAAVNLSLGQGLYTGACDSDPQWAPIRDQIILLRNAGIPTVAAAGNESSKTSINAPACLSAAIAVGATNLNDGLWDATNISPQVDLLAPGAGKLLGDGIVSSVPTTSGSTVSFNGEQGTSMAAAHVTGAWAVMKQKLGPAVSVDTVLQRLQNTGLYLSDTRTSGTQKWPRLRLSAALDADATCTDPFDWWGSDLTFDDNDWRGAADPVVINDPAKTHYFCSTVDEDWISFSASPDVTYQVETFALAQNNDTQLEVYHDTDPTPVATSDDADTGTYGSKVIFTPAESGIYYVRVRPGASGVGGSLAFAYSLRVRSLGNVCSDADDDTAATALPFTVNSIASRGLCGDSDQDWVKFQITKANTTLRLETLNLGVGQSWDGFWNQTDTVLELYGTDATTQLTSNDDVKGGVLRSLIEYTFTTPGTYYLKVRPYLVGGLGETYDVRLTRIDKPSIIATTISAGAAPRPLKKAPQATPEAAPAQDAGTHARRGRAPIVAICPEDTAETMGDGNDTAAAADPIVVGAQPQLQRFCSQTDEDWVKFDASANKTYQVETSDLSWNNDTRLTVYSDAGQTQVASNDDSDAGGYGSKLLFTPATAGTYYVRVRPVAGVGGDASFTYNVRVLDLGNPCSFNEPDSLPTQNKPFTVGQTEARGLCASGDADWVRFRITKANTTLRFETLNLGVGQDSSGGWHSTDTVLELYSTNGSTQLTSNDDVKGGVLRSLIEYTFATPGTYYLKVRGFNAQGGAGQTYDLRITRFDPLAPSSAASTRPGAAAKPLK